MLDVCFQESPGGRAARTEQSDQVGEGCGVGAELINE